VTDPATRRPPARESADLRIILRRVGHSGDLASKIRDSLHGLARMVPYVAGLADWLPLEIKPRLDTVRQDVISLSDYDAHIVNKVQLLLDATLGLINVEQNNIIKVLTIVSVVGIPPTLIASMYGMNFKDIPEYSWAWGYPYGLAVIALSAVLPLIWFKFRGWI
jgi:magnesium transporter